MMTRFDRFQRAAESTEIPAAYDLDLDQMTALIDLAKHGNPFKALLISFKFGYAQGCRKTKKEAALTAINTTSSAND